MSDIVLGCMRIEQRDAAGVRAWFDAGRSAGLNVFDHAAIYGSDMHGCERHFAESLELTPAQRDEIVLQTKCGLVRGQGYDSSAEHILASVDRSLEALRTDRIDVLLLHRPDALAEPEEIARAFDELESSGKVLAFGVSNHTPGQIDVLRTAVRQPIVVNQLQFSLAHAALVAQGIAANIEGEPQSTTLDAGGALDHSRVNGIRVQAWSPLQAGFIEGSFLRDERFAELQAVLERMAAERGDGVSAATIALAWIMRHPAGIEPVVGTVTPGHVEESARAREVAGTISRAEWYELFAAAGYRIP